MKPGFFYKHPNNTSVCVKVLKFFVIPEKNMASVKVEWYRCRADGRLLYCMGFVERFKKPLSYWKEWVNLGPSV